MTFAEIAEICRNCPIRSSGRRMLGDEFKAALLAPDHRGWFHACRTWVQGGLSPDEFTEIQHLLDSLNEYHRSIAQAHLDCARLLLNRQWTSTSAPVLTEDLCKIAEKTGLALGFLRDMVQELLPEEFGGGQPRQPVRDPLSLTALLVDEAQVKGVIANLTLELMPDGTGALYPAPALAFVTRDKDFRQAEDNARQYVRREGLWQEEWDVRWRLKRRDGKPLSPWLTGNSAGLAFALGLAKLLIEGARNA